MMAFASLKVPRQGGATLVELVITIVIISVAVAGVVGAFSTIAGRSSDALIDSKAIALAQVYLDEVLSKKYDNDTGEGGAVAPPGSNLCAIGNEGQSRATYDDVDDFDGVNDAPPRTPVGGIAAGYAGFAVAVGVACAGGEVGVANDAAKRIQVAVTTPQNKTLTFTVYRGHF